LIEASRERSGGELALIAAVAAHSAILACTDVVPVVKWPNDLLVRGRKIAGILIESRIVQEEVPAFVVGIGINCLQHRAHLPEELAQTATSLELESRQAIDRTTLAIALLSELNCWLKSPRSWSYTELRDQWLARAEPVGTRVELEQAGRIFKGTIIDLDPTAALVVRLDEGGIRAFNAASTTIVHR
jgi:BirA family biotin operon repressor/biotin-[acetyl-CoA-carboxylase] ligase